MERATGFEPAFSKMKAWRPRPLDHARAKVGEGTRTGKGLIVLY